MKHNPYAVLAICLLGGLFACQAQPASETTLSSAAPTSSVVPPNADTAQSALDSMDTRKAVPLLPMMAHHQKQNMRDHLVAVQEIVQALATEDFEAIEKSASRIGYSDKMGMMCNHMGAGAPGFSDVALSFHHTADAIGEAAKRRDVKGVNKALGDTLAKCTGCHATYKQSVVDQTSWTALTKRAAPAPGGGMPH